MMKKIGLALLCIALAAGVMFAAVGCQSNPVTDGMYLVEVDGGSGGGYYDKDVNCTVTAQIPEGKQFMKWVAGDEDKSANATYVFTVTENIKLTAVFADKVEINELYSVDVKFGSGSGNFYAGTQRVLSVADEYAHLEFTGWKATSKNASGTDVVETLSTANPYTLTVTKSMDIVAQFESVTFATPVNKNGEQFRIAGNGAYEFDRAGSEHDTIYVAGVDHVLFYMYDSNADDAEPVSTFKIVPFAETLYINNDKFSMTLSTMDGSRTEDLKGLYGDAYQDTATGKETIRSIIGAEQGKTYYFAAQVIAKEDTPYISSGLSAKGTGCTF